MLTPLQRRIASIVTGLTEAEDFALAGGGALVARGDVERTTRDLDYFARSADQVLRLLPALVAALDAEGFHVDTVRAVEGFARLVVHDGSSSTEIDLAHDFRLLPPEQTVVGPTLAAEELAIDKVLALFDRAEARDFVDLAAVVDRWGLDHLCRRAKEKDGGFTAEVLAQQLGRIDRLPAQDFAMAEEARQRLVCIVRSWQRQLLPPEAGASDRVP